jgi:methylmalonyl-CoA mutase cobalamin-binding domain/chain
MNQIKSAGGGDPGIFCQNRLIEAITCADRAESIRIIGEWTDRHGDESFFTEIMEPVLKRLGEEWMSQETVTIAQVFVAARIAEDVLARIAQQRAVAAGNPTPKGPVVFGNIEDDFHSLGRKMVVTFLRINGWEVIDLGNDVTPKEFVDTAVQNKARVIGVSAMTLTTAGNVARLREEIDSRGLKGKIQLAVGGAVFIVKPSLVQKVGGDGTATNALNAVPLFDRLWAAAVRESPDL